MSDPSAPTDRTLATYQATAEVYRARLPVEMTAPMRSFLDAVVDATGPGARCLELGSGAGRDATYLETLGLRVERTDGTPAFVAMMRRDGDDARLLDVRTADFGGPYDAVLALAMLLHLSRADFALVAAKARSAVSAGGLFALTVKEGDGEAWSTAKLGAPRWFTFWREAPLRAALTEAGWRVTSLEHVPGNGEDWLFVIAEAD
jgi:2-polyprenyl-3-methyl-5-hydroxy-6-metoxy-1,4-benzoquinol methylase